MDAKLERSMKQGTAATGISKFGFRVYDSNQPLFFSHIPKMGGTSLREVFQCWYGKNLLLHYNDPRNAIGPTLHTERLVEVSGQNPICVFGHFNNKKGRGFGASYPNASQFVTVFRDPLEIALSMHNFIKTKAGDWLEKPDLYYQTIDEFMETFRFEINSFLKTQVDDSNFKEVIASEYVYVGLLETLEHDIVDMARMLGFEPPPEIKKLNVLPRKKIEFSDRVLEKFRQRHQLEYAIYDWLLEMRR